MSRSLDWISIRVTRTLARLKLGDPAGRSELILAAYEDLRQLAAGRMAGERQDHTLTATALVNEISAKQLGDQKVPTQNRKQFFAYAAKAMRNLLIDHARTKGRQRRGGGIERVPLEAAENVDEKQRQELLALDEALSRFADVDSRKAQVVEMKYFGRMTNDEIAGALEISIATVKHAQSLP